MKRICETCKCLHVLNNVPHCRLGPPRWVRRGDQDSIDFPIIQEPDIAGCHQHRRSLWRTVRRWATGYGLKYPLAPHRQPQVHDAE